MAQLYQAENRTVSFIYITDDEVRMDEEKAFILLSRAQNHITGSGQLKNIDERIKLAFSESCRSSKP